VRGLNNELIARALGRNIEICGSHNYIGEAPYWLMRGEGKADRKL
jgi:hypothetical protein